MTATRPVALVTGAPSGIGEAATLAAAGVQAAGTSRNTSRVTRRDGVMFLDLDVTSDEPASTVARQVTGRSGRIGVLVSNAGAGAAGESSVALAPGVVDVNVFGLIRMTGAVLPHMRARERGRIINISSVPGFIPRSRHGRLGRVEARGRGLLRVPGPRGPRARRPGCCSSSRPSPAPR